MEKRRKNLIYPHFIALAAIAGLFWAMYYEGTQLQSKHLKEEITMYQYLLSNREFLENELLSTIYLIEERCDEQPKYKGFHRATASILAETDALFKGFKFFEETVKEMQEKQKKRFAHSDALYHFAEDMSAFYADKKPLKEQLDISLLEKRWADAAQKLDASLSYLTDSFLSMPEIKPAIPDTTRLQLKRHIYQDKNFLKLADFTEKTTVEALLELERLKIKHFRQIKYVIDFLYQQVNRVNLTDYAICSGFSTHSVEGEPYIELYAISYKLMNLNPEEDTIFINGSIATYKDNVLSYTFVPTKLGKQKLTLNVKSDNAEFLYGWFGAHKSEIIVHPK